MKTVDTIRFYSIIVVMKYVDLSNRQTTTRLRQFPHCIVLEKEDQERLSKKAWTIPLFGASYLDDFAEMEKIFGDCERHITGKDWDRYHSTMSNSFYGRGKLNRVGWLYKRFTKEKQLKLYFKSKEHATMFRMRWA